MPGDFTVTCVHQHNAQVLEKNDGQDTIGCLAADDVIKSSPSVRVSDKYDYKRYTYLGALLYPASIAGQSASSAGSKPETAQLPKWRVFKENRNEPV